MLYAGVGLGRVVDNVRLLVVAGLNSAALFERVRLGRFGPEDLVFT